jgi:hypothetical protein
MPDTDYIGWFEHFDDLADHPELWVPCPGAIDFLVVEHVTPNGAPGLLVRLTLPDGRAAVAGTDLMGTLDGLITGAAAMGWAARIPILGAPHRPEPGNGSQRV